MYIHSRFFTHGENREHAYNLFNSTTKLSKAMYVASQKFTIKIMLLLLSYDYTCPMHIPYIYFKT